MLSKEDLEFLSERITKPPFSKQLSVFQLHDQVTGFDLILLIHDAFNIIDQQNPTSFHKVDLRNEPPEETVFRFGETLKMLKYRHPDEAIDVGQHIAEGNRETLLNILLFLLKDLDTHTKRAYLARFLTVIEIPSEFMQDEEIAELHKQYVAMQEEFKGSHRYLAQLKQSAQVPNDIKREIQQMEEEKQQVLKKVNRLKKNVEEIPQHEKWLEAAQLLRLEQNKENDISEGIMEQKLQLEQSQTKLLITKSQLKEVKASNADLTPETLLQKLREEVKMNRYISEEKLAKAIREKKKFSGQMRSIIEQGMITEEDILRMETSNREINNAVTAMIEKKMASMGGMDDKLSLFRQQASIIAKKKEGTADRLNTLMEEAKVLAQEVKKKMEQSQATQGTKILKGDDFKRYVSELRGKSTIYKRKKMELSELAVESGILDHTLEVLKGKERALLESLNRLEEAHGIVGYQQAKETLEKVSERKGEIDEKKGKTLEEISSIVQSVIQSIQEKKTSLAPVIQELRNLRRQIQDMESSYQEKKKTYDSTMLGLESETRDLGQEVKMYRQDISNDLNRFHYLQSMIQINDITLERVLAEMKAYIGGDDSFEQYQKQRGFKAYRDLYNKKIQEQENLGKALREQQKEVKQKHEPNMKQLQMFKDLQKLLQLKVERNKKILERGGNHMGDEEFKGMVTQDRLVL